MGPFEFDHAIVRVIANINGENPILDRVILELFQMNTFKLMPIMTIIVALWLANQRDNKRILILLSGIIGSLASLIVTRMIQNFSPFHPRPALSGHYDFITPPGGIPGDWSSFPSDTSALAFALAYTVFKTSRSLGIATLIWAGTIVSFPRIYGGYHYPSDVIAGALIGVACVEIASRMSIIDKKIVPIIDKTSKSFPVFFYASFFFISFQMCMYFIDVRKVSEESLQQIGLVRTADANTSQTDLAD